MLWNYNWVDLVLFNYLLIFCTKKLIPFGRFFSSLHCLARKPTTSNQTKLWFEPEERNHSHALTKSQENKRKQQVTSWPVAVIPKWHARAGQQFMEQWAEGRRHCCETFKKHAAHPVIRPRAVRAVILSEWARRAHSPWYMLAIIFFFYSYFFFYIQRHLATSDHIVLTILSTPRNVSLVIKRIKFEHNSILTCHFEWHLLV
jgi:hypothetical protein